jgi:hypothetical protein
MNAMTHRMLAGAGTAAAACAGLALLAGPATAATTATAAPSAHAAACDAGAWGARVDGVPANFHAFERGGDYLFHTATGFHLRVTHADTKRIVFSGVITSPTAMRVDPVKLEKGDVLKLSADHKQIVFDFVNYGGIDGANFHTDCATTLTMSNLNMGNAPLSTDRVYLGKDRVHPSAIPFTVHRGLVKSSA